MVVPLPNEIIDERIEKDTADQPSVVLMHAKQQSSEIASISVIKGSLAPPSMPIEDKDLQ